MGSNIQFAYVGARTREITIGVAAVNIFAPAAGPPVIPYIANDRGIVGFVVQNNSGNDWYYSYVNTVTVPGGANPGMLIPKNGGQVSRQVSGGILQSTGFWIISSGAAEEGVVEEFI